MTSYDRIDWHLDSAIAAGQPEEHAFTHIGLYLAWLIRHDLHDPRMLLEDHVEAVKAGEMTGSDLADYIDGKLVSSLMNREGVTFSDARYDAYLGEYAKLFDELPEYGVEDGPEAHGMGRNGPEMLTVSIYDVPGIDAERLTSEFRSVIFRIPGSKWESRTISGREVQWASGEEFTVVFWARDSMVIHVTGQPEMVVPAISRLP